MRGRRAHAAVCLIRVEPQTANPLITLIVSRDLTGAGADPEPPRHVADVDEAGAAVTEFLRSCTGNGGRRKP